MPRRKTTDEFAKDVAKKHPTISVIGEYIDDKTPILLSCNICETQWEDKPRYVLHSSLGCPECNHKYVHVGYNDFATKAPHLVKFFKNKSQAKKITYMSHKLIELICPTCGTERTMTAFDLYRHGFHCQCCDDGVSYPNRIIRNVLKNFVVDNLQLEYSSKWTHGRLYDVYFELNNKKYIVEMDGAQHYYGFSSSIRQTYEEIKQIDDEKDRLAIENDVNVIRIDCRRSEVSYIKNNIIDSELSKLFDFTLIDWDYCNIQSQASIVFKVCDYYNANYCSLTELAERFGVRVPTIRHYLLRGNDMGLCHFQVNDTKRKRILAYCIDTDESYEFRSIGECANYLSNLFGTRYFRETIGQVADTGEIYKGCLFNKITGIAS